MNDQIPLKYRLFKLIDANPAMKQRELAGSLGLSLGKVNYCLKALVDKGFIKAGNFRSSKNKMAYAYMLTPAGMEEKIRITHQFYKRTEAEYEMLRKEVLELEVVGVRN
ncbi:MAG: MarR family EPS-associated transcriptional regulator [Mariprofundaceae bacterium]|nr:MarR family EPS-associated transcriptional regulator [Mariprofundaceae bacterium]